MAVGRNTSNAIDGHFSKNNRKIMKDINAYLQTFKEKKEKAKEAERKKKREATRRKIKEIYKQQKEAIQREKKELTNKLISQRKITPQKPPKWLTEPLSNNVGDFNEDTLFLTRDELQQWEAEHWPCINWDKWDELVEKGRKEILKHYHI
jgi:hypothetical protein